MYVMLLAFAIGASQTTAEKALDRVLSNEAVELSILKHAEPLFKCSKKFVRAHDGPATRDAAGDQQMRQQLIGEMGKVCGVSGEVIAAKATIKAAFPDFTDADAEAVAAFIVSYSAAQAAFAGP